MKTPHPTDGTARRYVRSDRVNHSPTAKARKKQAEEAMKSLLQAFLPLKPTA